MGGRLRVRHFQTADKLSGNRQARLIDNDY
jgi:hypothetical protein